MPEQAMEEQRDEAKIEAERQRIIAEIRFWEKYRLRKIAELGLTNLFFFNKEILEHGNPDRQKYLVKHVHDKWAKWLNRCKSRTRMILVPRNSLKSTFITVGFTLQQICKNRNVRILIANAKLENAQKFLSEIKWHLMNNQEMIDNYGEFYDKDSKWTETEIEVIGRRGVREPTVMVIGAGAGLASLHFDYIISDDLMNEVTSATREQADKIITWWRRSNSLLDPQTGVQILIGTRWTYYDLYHFIENEYQGEKDVYIRSAYTSQGKAYYPEMLSLEELEKKKLEEGSYIFSAFYLNDPIDDENSLIKKSSIHYYDSECECGELHQLPDKEELAIFVSCDPASSQSKKADRSTIEVVGVDSDSRWYVLETRFGRWQTNELLENLFDTYTTWKPISMTIEVLSQAQHLMQSVYDLEKLKGIHLPLIEIKSRVGKSKQARVISNLQPRFERGEVLISRKMAALEEELLRFPHIKHDDLIDALCDIGEICFSPEKMEEQERFPVTMQERVDASIARKNDFLFDDPVLGEVF